MRHLLTISIVLGILTLNVCAQTLSGGLTATGSLTVSPTIPIGSFGDTNLDALTGNNTSGCSAVSLPFYCTGVFMPLRTSPANSGALTPIVNPVPANVSPMSAKTLLYAGFTGRIGMHGQPWFCMGGTQTQVLPDGVVQQSCSGHQKVGYQGNDANVIAGKVNDMIRRGVNFWAINHYGTHGSQAGNKQMVDNVKTYLSTNNPKALDGSFFTMAANLDKGAITPYCTTTQTTWSSGTSYLIGNGVVFNSVGYIALTNNSNKQPDTNPTDWQLLTTCLINAFNAQFDSIRDLYAEPSGTVPTWYESRGGNPIVLDFITESAWSNTDWTAIRFAYTSHVHAYAHPFILLRNYDGATIVPTGYDGAYAWINPPTWSVTNQLFWGWSAGLTPAYFDNFYDQCKIAAQSGKTCMGGASKGFDDNNATWSLNRVRAQRLGNTLLLQIGEVTHNNDFGVSNQLPLFAFATLDDYEEGTELETGIDNGVSVSIPSSTGDTLTWTVSFSDPTYGSLATVDHFRILYGPNDGSGQLTTAIDNLPNITTSRNLASIVPFGTWKVYVQAVGRAFMWNALSNASAYTNPSSTCGPPTYLCARTDLIPAPAPTAPNVGNLTGAGTCFNDPDFGSKVCRLSDATTAGNLTISAHGGGSGRENPFNTDSSKLIVDTTGGGTIPMNFDPQTMIGTKMGWTLALAGNASWSHLNPDLLYAMGPTSPTGLKTIWVSYDTSLPSPSPVTVYDYRSTNCLGANFVSTWVGTAGISKDDVVFGSSFSNVGGQGTGIYVVAYNKTLNKCRMLNLATGIVTSDAGWGTTGAVPNWVAMTDADGITIHSTEISKDGDWIDIVAHNPSCPTCATNEHYFWNVPTINVTQNPVGANLGGHSVVGYTHWVNANGSPIGQYKIRPFTALGSQISVIPPANFPSNPSLTTPFAAHQGWSNVDSNDTYPFFITTFRAAPVPVVAWYNEVLGISPVTGTVYRFAHSQATGLSHRFATQQTIGAISQDGRFFYFSSDWQGTLGSESGGATCLTGGGQWLASHAYVLNEKVNTNGITPTATSNNFTVTTAGTSGTTAPVWSTKPNIGDTITDGTAVWTNIGPGTCRGDVFVVNLAGGGLAYYADATNGSDSNPGSFSQPVQTEIALKALVRNKPGATAVLRGTSSGTYYPVTSTVSFDSGDSGVTWKALPGEKAIISGGTRLTGWVNTTGNQWTHSGAGLADAEVLFYNGAFRYKPRLGSGFDVVGTQYRVAGTISTCGTGTSLCFDKFTYSAADAPVQGTWTNLNNSTGPCGGGVSSYPIGDIVLHYFFTFKGSRMRIKCRDTAAHIIVLTGNIDANSPFTVGRRFTIENVEDAAGTATQWYWNKVTNVITYYAGPGENPNTAQVIIPQTVPPLISASGLSNVLFMGGLQFSFDNQVVASTGYKGEQSEFSLPSLFRCLNCTNVVWDGVTFTATTSHALKIDTDATGTCSSNTVRNSAFHTLGAGGIYMGRFPPSPSDTDANICQNNVAKNNRVKGIGRLYPFGGAIGSFLEQHTDILQNEVDDGYSYAIFSGIPSPANMGLGTTSGPIDTEIAFNKVYNIGHGLTWDFGGIYTVPYTALQNTVHNNIVHHIDDASKQDAAFAFSTGPGGVGIYVDNVSQDVSVDHNLVYKTSNASVRSSRGPQTNGHPNIIDNNILALSRTGAIIQGLAPPSVLQQFIARNNLIYVDKTYSDTPAFHMQANCGPFGTPLTNVQLWNPNLYFNPNTDISAPGYTDLFPTTTSNCTITGYVSKATWVAAGEDTGSVWTDPGFVSVAAENFNLSGPSPLPSFIPFSLTAPGLLSPSLVPAVPTTVLPGWPADPYVDSDY